MPPPAPLELVAEDAAKALLVTNVAADTTEEALNSFFSFCGSIKSVTVLADPAAEGDQLQQAVVVFQHPSSANTGLLLSNALINDRPIKVFAYPVPAGQQEPSAPPAGDVSAESQQETSLPEDHRSATAVVASLLAAGYKLGGNVVTSAREFDERHNISLRLMVAAESGKAKANELDQEYHITEKMQAAKVAASTKAQQIDEQYHVKDRAMEAAIATKTTANVLASKAMQVGAVNSAVGVFKRGLKSAKDTAKEIKEETAKQIEEQKRLQELERQRQAAPEMSPLDNPQDNDDADTL